MVRSSEPMVSLGDPVAANIERTYLLLSRLVGRHVVDKRFTPLLNRTQPPPMGLLSVLVETVPPPEVLDPDRVQVVFPEPRTPSTLMIKAALAVAQASARPISVTS